MKLAIITDQHFGARKGADYIHGYFKKFYDNIFFPYLEKNKIDTVVDMGDTFDNRRNIDLATLEWSKKNSDLCAIIMLCCVQIPRIK